MGGGPVEVVLFCWRELALLDDFYWHSRGQFMACIRSDKKITLSTATSRSLMVELVLKGWIKGIEYLSKMISVRAKIRWSFLHILMTSLGQIIMKRWMKICITHFQFSEETPFHACDAPNKRQWPVPWLFVTNRSPHNSCLKKYNYTRQFLSPLKMKSCL